MFKIRIYLLKVKYSKSLRSRKGQKLLISRFMRYKESRLNQIGNFVKKEGVYGFFVEVI